MSTCNTSTLLADGKCFACLTPGEWDLVRTQLWCEIVAAQSGGGGGCVPPEQPTAVNFTGDALNFDVVWTSATNPSLDFLVEWGTVAGPPFANSQSVAPGLRVLNNVAAVQGSFFGRVTARNATDCVTVGTPDNDPFDVTFDPSDIAGLVLWLDASTLVASQDDPIANWPDISGNANHFQGGLANDPLFDTNEFPSGVLFDAGSSNLLQCVNTLAAMPFTLLIVCNLVDTGTVNVILGIDALAAFSYLNGGGGGAATYFSNAGITTSNAGQLTLGIDNAMGMQAPASPGEIIFIQNNVNLTNSAQNNSGGGFNTGQPALGALWDGAVGSNFITGVIAEVVMYNSVLSAANRTALQTYFAAKWGL